MLRASSFSPQIADNQRQIFDGLKAFFLQQLRGFSLPVWVTFVFTLLTKRSHH
jgi:hypothetical protein